MNILEAIVLLTTSSEINNGLFFKFCDQFIAMRKNKLHFIVYVNNYNFDDEFLTDYLAKITIFKSIKVVNLNIPKSQDVYIKFGSDYTDNDLPPLGCISGPNILFLKAMRSLYKYNTILLLETDCCLKRNCFEISESYIKHCSDFIVSGSRYIGTACTDITNQDLTSLFNLHLNGVAFYRTGSKDFENVLNKMEKYILSSVKLGSVFIPYDMALTDCLLHATQPSEFLENRRLLSKFCNTTFILNMSPEIDAEIPYEEINTTYPSHIILHTKKHYWETFQ